MKSNNFLEFEEEDQEAMDKMMESINDVFGKIVQKRLEEEAEDPKSNDGKQHTPAVQNQPQRLEIPE